MFNQIKGYRIKICGHRPGGLPILSNQLTKHEQRQVT